MKKAFGILAGLVVTACCVNASSAAQKLSLKEAIRMAMEKNHQVRGSDFNADAARQGVAIAGSHYYPNVMFEESLAGSNSPTQTFMMKLDEGRFTNNDFQINNLNHPATWQNFRTALSLQQPLYNPSLGPAREMAMKTAEAASLGADATKQDIAFQVFRLYLEIQKAEAYLKTAEQAVADAREHARLATVRNDSGVGLRSDQLMARTQLSFAEQQSITARNNLTLAKMQLAITIGLGDGESVEVSDPMGPTFAILQPDELDKIALEKRSDLQQTRANTEVAAAGLKLARNAYLPMVDAFASYQLNDKDVPFGADNDSWLAGVSLKWQIFDGFRRGHERERAAASRSAADEMLAGQTKQIKFQIKESYLRREEMGKRLEVARHALEDAEESVRLISKRFENSLATMIELLDAQTALNQTRTNLVETEANYALASGRVYYTAGIFTKEILK
ncbi:MAG: TolC family protein [Geobacter sp.]|nr:MAG: TolC family protein [Geobacter sp.]